MSADQFEQTLAGACAGAAWACTAIYEDLRQPVLGYVRLRGADDPDDVASEVFLCVFRDLERFEGDHDDFRAWVFTIAHRRVLDAWRRRSRRPRVVSLDRDVDAQGGDSEDEALARLGMAEVERLLDRLTPDQRDVVLLRVIADFSLERVADVMERSVGAVKGLQHRALIALREAVDESLVTPSASRAIWRAR